MQRVSSPPELRLSLELPYALKAHNRHQQTGTMQPEAKRAQRRFHEARTDSRLPTSSERRALEDDRPCARRTAEKSDSAMAPTIPAVASGVGNCPRGCAP